MAKERCMSHSTLLLLGLTLVLVACGPKFQETDYDPAGATDTEDREIAYQVKRSFRLDEGMVTFSNEFAGARLNAVEPTGPQAYRLTILPENEPINKSPWYAFQVWAEDSQVIHLTLSYPGYAHRYVPKVSSDGSSWTPVDSGAMQLDTTSGELTFSLPVGPARTWVAGQELLPSDSTYAWEQRLIDTYGGEKRRIGFSHLGKPIHLLSFGNQQSKDWVFVMGRQHPPEVSGYLASQAFVERLLDSSDLARRFREQYRIVVAPMLNPDGVDLGHWRQSGGGVDINRDWANFHQPEPRALRDYLLEADGQGAKIHFAVDFHSTDYDMYYVFTDDMATHRQGFTGRWLQAIKAKISGYEPDTEATDMNSPSAKYFFFTELEAEFVTFEVGDETPRQEVRQRAVAGAEAMMELLLE